MNMNSNPLFGKIILVTLALSLFGACTTERVDPPRDPVTMLPPPGGSDSSTFRERVFYELWVRSFQDSDGDGIGDLPGLVSRLDELVDLGVGGLWLMPTFPSPLVDSGYDVADYFAVHPDYGTLADMDALLTAAHGRGLLVYLDMVFNHTSDEHIWFQSALDGPGAPFHDYYVWATEPTTKCKDGPPSPPFPAEKWTYVEELDLYYFHQFYSRQPDLNFHNPEVGDALLDVLRFWLDRGVDGFRFDVPERFYEEGNKCTYLHETREYHARMREVIAGIGTLEHGFVSELLGLHSETKEYFGADGNPMIFNFFLMFAMYTSVAGGESAGGVAVQVEAMMKDLPEESRWALIIGNHDTPRFAEVAWSDPARMRLAAALQMTLPGVPFMWMGDELGLSMGTDVIVDWRDGSRTPYPWDGAAPGLGFTTGKPHLGFTADSRELAHKQQRADGDSLLNYYRRLILLRNQTPALHKGGYESIHLDKRIWVYARQADGEVVYVAHNFGRDPAPDILADTWLRRGTATGKSLTDLLTGEIFAANAAVTLAPGQSRILRVHP
jgi:glycosidase